MKKKNMVVIGMVVGCLMLVTGAAWAGDNGNGTVTVGGLVWLKNAGFLGKMTWNQAVTRVQSIKTGNSGLSDNSKAGDWRLPTRDELLSMCSHRSELTAVQLDEDYWSVTPGPDKTKSGSTYNTSWGVEMINCQFSTYYGRNVNLYVVPVRSIK